MYVYVYRDIHVEYMYMLASIERICDDNVCYHFLSAYLISLSIIVTAVSFYHHKQVQYAFEYFDRNLGMMVVIVMMMMMMMLMIMIMISIV